MTGNELLDQLKTTGTGASKLEAVRGMLGKNTSPQPVEVVDALQSLGYSGTVEKAVSICAGVGIKVGGPGALFSAMEKLRADNDLLKAELADLKKQKAGTK